MKLYFVRHGQTLWNIQKIFQGVKNSNLTELGKEETRKLKERLKDVEFTHFYSSPLGRTIETINILTEDRNNPEIRLIPEFQEIYMGDIEGMPNEEALRKYPDELYNLWNDGAKYNPESFGGETFESVFARTKKGLDRIVSQHKDDDVILIVSHGIALDVIFENMRGNSFDSIKERNVPANASVTVVRYENGVFYL